MISNFFDEKPQISSSQAARELKPLIFAENCQVLSSFELNKIASLTFGDIVCDEIFELIESVVSQPLHYTPLTIQKTLVMLKHILVYGSEKCVNSAYGIGKFVEQLQNFNTILWTQQQQGMNAMWQRLQGGGVDRGGPVRDAATEVCQLLGNINELQRIRMESASKDSLVPIGDDKVAFVTDEVRHYILKKRIEKQQRLQIKSNLAKSEGGFGGGYNAKDGKSVVGAAHGIDEMIKMAKLEKKKWSDESNPADTQKQREEMRILQELKAQADAERAELKRQADEAAMARNASLLDDDNNNNTSSSQALFGGGGGGAQQQQQQQQQVDLLDFGGTGGGGGVGTTSTMNQTVDLFGGGGGGGPTATQAPAASNDLLGLMAPPTGPTTAATTSSGGAIPSTDIFGVASSSTGGTATTTSDNSLLGGGLSTISAAAVHPVVDPFAPSSTQQQQQQHLAGAPLKNNEPATTTTSITGPLGGVTSELLSLTLGGGSGTNDNKKSVMTSNEDRFSALDALATTTSAKPTGVTELDRKNAENRILGFTPTTGVGLGGVNSQAPPKAAAAPQPPSGGALVPHYGGTNSNDIYYNNYAATGGVGPASSLSSSQQQQHTAAMGGSVSTNPSMMMGMMPPGAQPSIPPRPVGITPPAATTTSNSNDNALSEIEKLKAENERLRLLAAAAQQQQQQQQQVGGAGVGIPSTMGMMMPPSQPPPTTMPPNNNSIDDSLLSMPTMEGIAPQPQPEPVVVNPGSVRVGQMYGDAVDADEDNPWVMGGTIGSGLNPTAAAPGSAPPPPPP